MTTKIVKLTLSYPWFDDSKSAGQERFDAPRVYRIEKIIDSVDYSPGEMLDRAEVADLCASKHWSVTMQTHADK